MKIVIDTNVLISGVFFGGDPRQVLDAVIDSKIKAYASPDIIEEYQEILEEMIYRKQGHLNKDLLKPLFQKFSIIIPTVSTDICRDPDDNKFLDCAKESKALFIVSGDKDLLVLEHYENTEIITAKEFCEKYL